MRIRRRGGNGSLVWGAVLAAALMFLLPQGQALAADAPAIQTYQVAAGDTLWLLAQRYQASLPEIRALNNWYTDNLEPGQVLFLPVLLRGQGVLYRVQRGDTLYLISRRAGRSIESIKQMSGLQSDSLVPGQVLLLPAARPGASLYVVAPGDSLYKISTRFGLGQGELAAFNRLPSPQLLAGQLLEIPAAAPAPPPAAPPAPAPDPVPPGPAPELPVYRVAPGDTLSTIAQRFGTTAPAIYQTNRLHSDLLMPGQPLYIPPGPEPVQVAGPRGEQKEGYGELLDWEWARWIYNVGSTAVIQDFSTGRTFRLYYLGGSNHADTEPLTRADTATMLELFGGQWSWNKRPVLVKVEGRVLAASLAGQPHSVETIADNGVEGHFDLYFWNSRSHNTGEIQPDHQQNVLLAAGRQ